VPAPAIPPAPAEASAQTALPVPHAPNRIRAPAGTNQTPDISTAAAPENVAAPGADEPQIQPASQTKKPAPAAAQAKPATNEAKPAPLQAATTGGSGSTIFVTSATSDVAMPLPATDASASVKTVPLSNLANLPNGAAVTAIGTVIASEAAAGTSRFLIRLDPPELGRVDVRIRFGRDGEVHARLIADRPETASLLMRDAAVLERALNASGVRTSDAGIDVMLRDSSGGFARTDGGPNGETPVAPPYRPLAAAVDLPDAPAWIPPALSGRLDLSV
jgi:flagellar hook-length control protein FliK